MAAKHIIRQYAFWEYDKFPFVLSGEIVGRSNTEGYVKVRGFDGLRFKPLRIVSGTKGKAISEKLERLRSAYRNELDNLKQDFCGRALKIAPFLKSCRRTSAYDSFGRTRKATRVALAE